jgi:(p)ppGpp synthase/HD superfamily hydrolase
MARHDDAAMVELAQSIATRAHAGQVDKAGADYISHPARVAARLHTPLEQMVGWLHDVAEDTNVGLDDLTATGLPAEAVAAVDALTRRAGENSDAYYGRVAADPLAVAVKHADLADNTDPARLSQLDAETQARLGRKYAHARAVLPAPAGA